MLLGRFCQKILYQEQARITELYSLRLEGGGGRAKASTPLGTSSSLMRARAKPTRQEPAKPIPFSATELTKGQWASAKASVYGEEGRMARRPPPPPDRLPGQWARNTAQG